MNLMEVVSAANGQIKGTADYTWKCFGDSARYLDIGNDDTGQQASVIFDTDDGTVYAMEIFLPAQSTAFRWIDERYADLFVKECMIKSIDPNIAFDRVRFQEMTSTEALMTLDELTKNYAQVLPDDGEEEEDEVL
jgi:hypothetical protein